MMKFLKYHFRKFLSINRKIPKTKRLWWKILEIILNEFCKLIQHYWRTTIISPDIPYFIRL